MAGVVLSGFVPKELINVDEVRLQLLNALRKEGRRIRRDLNKTTATWKHEVKFNIKVSLRRTVATGYVKVWTTDEIYGYVNDGTKPHPMGPIRPKKASALRIPTGGTRPKTRPGSLKSGRGGQIGPFVFAKSTRRFMHPGTRARKFTHAEVEKMKREGTFQNALSKAVDKGMEKAASKGLKEVG